MTNDPILHAIKDTGCRPSIEIDWDMWARTRIICDHGTFEGVSGGLNIQESFDSASAQFNAYDHIYRCSKVTPIPDDWVDGINWHKTDTDYCELFKGHDGDCLVYVDDVIEENIRKTRIPVCIPCGKELTFINDPKSWVHKHDKSERCKMKEEK
jgi:hypothetical protein